MASSKFPKIGETNPVAPNLVAVQVALSLSCNDKADQKEYPDWLRALTPRHTNMPADSWPQKVLALSSANATMQNYVSTHEQRALDRFETEIGKYQQRIGAVRQLLQEAAKEAIAAPDTSPTTPEESAKVSSPAKRG